jgi:XTP/dITP diphosphohydrolase
LQGFRILQEFEQEVKHANSSNMEEEFGDLLFAMINAARLYGINPENALEKTNQKFIQRFGYMEEEVQKNGRVLKDLTLAEMDQLWEEAKKNLR